MELINWEKPINKNETKNNRRGNEDEYLKWKNQKSKEIGV